MESSNRLMQINERITYASEQLEHLYTSLNYGENVDLYSFVMDILPIIKEAAAVPRVYQLLYEVHKKEAYAYRHSICVSILSLMLAKWIDLEDEELEMVAIGALLHDIGNTRIDPFVLNKPGRLTKDEYEEIQLHTVYGYERLRMVDQWSDRVALVALQHHEREDGRGYPKGLVGNQIDVFSKIVAVADIFHAMLSARVYQNQASPFSTVMQQIQDDSFGRIDPNIAYTLTLKIMDSIVGQDVELVDGRIAKVVMVHSADPLFPLIQIQDEFIDLRQHRNLIINKVVNLH